MSKKTRPRLTPLTDPQLIAELAMCGEINRQAVKLAHFVRDNQAAGCPLVTAKEVLYMVKQALKYSGVLGGDRK